MKRQLVAASILVAVTCFAGAACRGKDEAEEGREVPRLMRIEFETQMKMILHDLKRAEEVASAERDTYVGLDALRASYFNRPVPKSYELTLSDVSASTFRAQVVHKPSGVRCWLQVGVLDGQPGAGVPVCR